jgi:hypothetical protein
VPRTAPPAILVAIPVAALLAGLTLAVLPGAAAFGSSPGGPHDEITAAAAREAGLPEEVVPALVEAVRAVDARDPPLEPGARGLDRTDAAGEYRPEQHCARVPPADDRTAFRATVDHVADRSEAALAAVLADDPEEAVQRMGELLHAVQDCFSHSNAVDLDAPEAVVAAVNGHAAAPDGLRLTGYQPGADDPEAPDGDPYPHREFAKDGPDANDESAIEVAENETKFEAARTLAIEASIMALQDILRELEPEHLERLADAQGGGQPIPRVGVPTVAPALVVLALVVSAARLRRSRR